MREEFAVALAELKKRRQPSIAQLELLLSASSGAEEEMLFTAADVVRHQELGDAVHLRGLIEFSNYCSWDCHYCGLRRSNQTVNRYRLSEQQLEAAAFFAAQHGYRTLVLQAGEDGFYSGDQLADMVRRVKRIADVAVTLSVGLRSRADFEKMRRAGADRYLMKQEISEPDVFAKLRPGTELKERVACLKWLKQEGWQVGSGFMIGLPGQTRRTLAQDLLLLQEIGVEMAGIGPFLPHPETPLREAAPGSLDDSLRALATARLLLPTVHMPATSAIGTLDPQGQRRALACGANVVMPNLSPTVIRKAYQLYPGKVGTTEDAMASHERVVAMLKEINRPVALDRGDGIRR
ncbi:[FeFe] hydrogenase H-cluster radical SAM maturase HydE [Azotosporobacter soli]|uniref:[FeFe] hydrogenase H-cluster radical SAM maturase HydE n=1 Tax=Azotosporobacter soli TaxID=3055040 RepID=UPI0031FEA53B